MVSDAFGFDTSSIASAVPALRQVDDIFITACFYSGIFLEAKCEASFAHQRKVE